MCTDVCIKGLGGVIMQEVYVIFQESRKLKEPEKNYVTHDLDLEAIVHALNIWSHYLLERRFELRINHVSLKYLFDQPSLHGRQARVELHQEKIDKRYEGYQLEEGKVIISKVDYTFQTVHN